MWVDRINLIAISDRHFHILAQTLCGGQGVDNNFLPDVGSSFDTGDDVPLSDPVTLGESNTGVLVLELQNIREHSQQDLSQVFIHVLPTSCYEEGEI